MLARFRWRSLWVALAIVCSLNLIAVIGFCGWLLNGLPSLDDLHGYAAAPSSKVYDRHGRLLFEMPPPHTGRHSPIALGEIPAALRQAIVATEDASFYENPGVDGWAILRAVWINLRGGEILSGGSTITQQLARNLLMSPDERYERTLIRKLREAMLAWRIARRYSKDEILELYLNEIYFGNMAYGVEAAAQAYFGKHVRDLDLAECAMLAGLPQAPEYYNPLENQKAAKARQTIVLGLMVKHGYLSEEQARQAQEEKLYFASAPFDIRAPHFVMYVRGILEKELGLERLEQGGLSIYTTLDVDLNEAARDVVRHRLELLAQCQAAVGGGLRPDECPPGGHNVRNAALVALDPQTGEILAMLGSPDYFSARIDGAVNGTTALRQPGSSIKPITYAAAFDQRATFGQTTLTPATMMLDVRTSFVTKEGESYVPLNYDLQFRGPVRLREALGSSYNLIAVKVLENIGVAAMTDLARRLGITTFDDLGRLGLSVTLGGGEVRLLEETAAFAAFANGGHVTQPVAIRRVEDAKGNVLWSQGLGVGERVLDERVTYLITHILSDDVARIPSFGEGSALELTRPAAVKTGTTTDFRDNWTVGYTPDLVVGVWTGNADNEPMRNVSGISGAAPIWHDFMESALRGQPAGEFGRPDGLVEVEVCALSGLLPGRDCPHRVREIFIEGTEPAETCTMHQRIALDRSTGLRATTDTPPEQIVQRVYTVLPAEAQDWAHEHGIPEPPSIMASGAEFPAPRVNAESPLLAMGSPDAGAVYRLDPALPRDAQRIVISARPGTGLAPTRVRLLVDGQVLAEFSGPPYEVLWQLQPGLHTFSAEAADARGTQVMSDKVWVEVRE
ncbi:MAG TPA: PBP1A family penicillin-binding protein [Anaerolineae bacterium]|nr:PBP1A family penicillin-binding protein [Anaerolineae bacterium]